MLFAQQNYKITDKNKRKSNNIAQFKKREEPVNESRGVCGGGKEQAVKHIYF